LVAAAKLLVAATKILSVVPYFVAVTKPFFPCETGDFLKAKCKIRRIIIIKINT